MEKRSVRKLINVINVKHLRNSEVGNELNTPRGNAVNVGIYITETN